MNIMRIVVAVCLCLFIETGINANTAFGQTPRLSAAELCKKCQAAYDALGSYSCHVVDRSVSPIPDANSTMAADIKFIRPGELLAAGYGPLNSKYRFVVDGKSISNTSYGSTSSLSEDVQTGMFELEADSSFPTADVPYLLLDDSDGSPFGLMKFHSTTATTENVGGRPCYKIQIGSPSVVSVWIDAQTFLVVKVVTAMESKEGNVRRSGYMVQTITQSQINPEIPTSDFTVPKRGSTPTVITNN